MRGGKGEGEDTDRAAGSGPFLGGLDCLAAVAICKTQSVKAETNEGRESREAERCECGERNGDSVLSDNTGRNVECGTERRGQVGLQRCRRDCVRRAQRSVVVDRERGRGGERRRGERGEHRREGKSRSRVVARPPNSILNASTPRTPDQLPSPSPPRPPPRSLARTLRTDHTEHTQTSAFTTHALRGIRPTLPARGVVRAPLASRRPGGAPGVPARVAIPDFACFASSP